MNGLIQRLDQWLQQNCPEYYAVLQPGVEQDLWLALEQSLGVALPNEFKQIYQWRNGDAIRCGQYERIGFWFPYNWMPHHSVLNARKTLNGLLDDGEFALESWWNSRWVPFFEFNNNYLCLDMAGCWTGQIGQVLEFWHEDCDRRILAPSFRQWLEALMVGLEQGRLVYQVEAQRVVSTNENNTYTWLTAHLPNYPRYVEAGWTLEEGILPPTLAPFTPEQLTQIPAYWAKWLSCAQRTARINQPVIRTILERTYRLLGLECPAIHFAESPLQAVEMLLSQEEREGPGPSLADYFGEHLLYNYAKHLRHYQPICQAPEWPQDNLALQNLDLLNEQVMQQIEEQIDLSIQSFDGLGTFGFGYPDSALLRAFCLDSISMEWGVFADINISLRNWKYDPERWELFQALMWECGWIYPLENVCVVCDRPTVIDLTADPPCIEFSDGFTATVVTNDGCYDEY